MRNPAFGKVVEEILALHDRKNADYGTQDNPLNNLQTCKKLGLEPTLGIVVRLQDKWSRIENFYRNGDLKNESLRDSFIDNAIYSLLAVTVLDAEEAKTEFQVSDLKNKRLVIRNDISSDARIKVGDKISLPIYTPKKQRKPKSRHRTQEGSRPRDCLKDVYLGLTVAEACLFALDGIVANSFNERTVSMQIFNYKSKGINTDRCHAAVASAIGKMMARGEIKRIGHGVYVTVKK